MDHAGRRMAMPRRVRNFRDFCVFVLARAMSAIRQRAEKFSALSRVIFAKLGRLMAARNRAGMRDKPEMPKNSPASSIWGLRRVVTASVATGNAVRKIA